MREENILFKIELTQFKTNQIEDETEKENLSKEIAHVKKLYSAMKHEYQVLLNEFQNQETELGTAQTRTKILACQKQTEFDLQQTYVEEIATKNKRIKELEANCHDLKRKFIELEEKYQEESSEAQDRRLHSKIKRCLDEADTKVKALRFEAKKAREAYTTALSIQAQGWEEESSGSARNSKSKDENDVLVIALEKRMKRTNEDLWKAEKDLAARRNELNSVSNIVSTQGEALTHRSKDKGSPHATYSSTPGLTNSEGRSTSSLSISPPYPETMEPTILDRHFKDPPYALFGKSPPDAAPTRSNFDTRSHASRKGKKPLR